MTLKLPRRADLGRLGTLEEVSQQFVAFAEGVYDFLRLMPTIEHKTITTVGNFPIYVETQTKRAISVKRVQSYETDDSSSTATYLADTSLSWRLSDDPDQPGIVITGMGGAIGPEEITVVLEIMGERVT